MLGSLFIGSGPLIPLEDAGEHLHPSKPGLVDCFPIHDLIRLRDGSPLTTLRKPEKQESFHN